MMKTQIVRNKIKKLVERITHTRILRVLPRGVDLYCDIRSSLPFYTSSVVFDVGAYTGQSAESFKRWFPQAQIYCFEPTLATFAKLQRRFLNIKNVHCLRLALGASKGRGELRLHRSSDNNLFVFCGPDYEKTEAVEIEAISTFCRNRNISKIDFLKIDTEGYDLSVLMGAVDMLDDGKIDLIQLEAGMNRINQKHVPLEEAKAYLEAKGYFLFGIYEQMYEWPTGEPHMRRSNAVFISSNVIMANRLPHAAQRVS